MDVQLQWLIDRAQITDTVTAFAVALDMRNWELLGRCLTDPLEIAYPNSVGVGTYARDHFLAIADKFFSNLDATLHISANHQIEIDGDRATCVSTLFANHHLASAGERSVQRQIGYYKNHLVRLDQWTIFRTEQHDGWMEGNPAVFASAAAAFE